MKNRCRLSSVLALLLLLSGCGGGGGIAAAVTDPGGGGIGGSGVTSSGPVTGFGSVFVNGIEFETDDADIIVNGARVTEDALGLGMVVLVRGSVNDDGVTGVASTVVFDGAVQGPIESIERGVDGDVLLLGVLGVEVIVERRATVFAGVTFASLRSNDLVEVSGFFDPEGRLQSTRIEKKSDFVPDESEIDRAGAVADLMGTEFVLGDFNVDFSAADLSTLPDATVSDGLRVLVSGTLNATTITARAIRLVADVARDLAANEEVNIQGTITDFENVGRFAVRGVVVDASDATLELSGETLRSGLLVQVAGVWDGEQLVARNVSSRQARIVVAATVEAVSVAERTVSLNLYESTMTLIVNAETLIVDSTGQRDRLRLADISSGDYLVVEALVRGNSRLALRIARNARSGNVLRAAVEGFDRGGAITLQGIVVNTAGAEFLASDGTLVSADVFYEQLQVGDLVRVTDSQSVDGAVDEVRIVSADVVPVQR